MSATFADARPAQLGWLDWLRRELAPSHERKVRTLILVCGAVLCVIISMTLQVPDLAVSAYMVFFFSKESKVVTTVAGLLGVFGVTIAIGISLLLYKFTYGHPEFRIPAMAIALFFGMYLSRIFVIGPLGFALGFVIAVVLSVGESIPSPELIVREILWIWVAVDVTDQG
jgi:multidrug resistance protein MdtO